MCLTKIDTRKFPVVLLLDEPTWDLDPLNTYLVISILSNAAKKYGSAIILTMEKPRSDVFPFLERVLYLCLGDVVYSGGTRQMLEYFNEIGFPCPQLENPLMYYCKYYFYFFNIQLYTRLCISTEFISTNKIRLWHW